MKTDNDHIDEKILLRKEVLSFYDNPKILECFGGRGFLWSKINEKYKLTSIEILPDKFPKPHLLGDSFKFLKSFNLNEFDIIDLDAYGVPFNHLEEIFNQNFKGHIIVTFIQSGMGSLPKKMLNLLGFTNEMINKIPTLFNRKGIEKFKNYLYIRGSMSEITGYFINRKNYFYFKLK